MSEGTITIEIDSEVFEFLQSEARAFVDTPNDVLRRLLLGESTSRDHDSDVPANLPTTPKLGPPDSQNRRSEMQTPNVKAFVGALLEQEFGSQHFRKRGSYRLMFENDEVLVYVQNFNKPSDHLWYRIADKPWQELQSSSKDAWVCFTNPPDQLAYKIPVNAIVDHIQRSGWDRDHLEVNIDPISSRWVELAWNIETYKKRVVGGLEVVPRSAKVDQALELLKALSAKERQAFLDDL